MSFESRVEKFEKVAPNRETAERWARERMTWPEEMIDQVIAYKRLDKALKEALDLCVEMWGKRIFRVAGVERTRNMTVQEWAVEVLRKTVPEDLAEYLDDYLELEREP